jgi:hypothetical protein
MPSDEVSGSGPSDRAYTGGVLTRIARPVLEATSRGELHRRLPIHDWERHRAAWTHYEALARTLAGIAPWLALDPDGTPEGRERSELTHLARAALVMATDPGSADYMNFGSVPSQPLVETAYLASALLAAPGQLWEPLDGRQRARVLDALRMNRRMRPPVRNNWLLFPALAEAALWKLGGDARLRPIRRAVRTFGGKWYLGDGVYGDGPRFRWDYYNSFVIHPMLLQVLTVAREQGSPLAAGLDAAVERAGRYAAIQERLISPEGTFPLLGRSAAYRFAALHHLSYSALHRQLPPHLTPGAVRAALTAVIRRMADAPGTLDGDGWLTLGAVGPQPALREAYNSTGSLYVCLTGLVHLGLPATDPFWLAPPAPWTQLRLWSGGDVPRDEALEPHRQGPGLSGLRRRARQSGGRLLRRIGSG